MMEVVVTTGAVRRAKFQSDYHHQKTNICFYRSDALPVAEQFITKFLNICYCIEFYETV